MASPSERATFPVDNPSSRRFNPTAAAPAGDSGSSTVSSLERSFGDLDINPSSSSSSASPSLPPPSAGPTGGIVSRTLMERSQQHWQDERKKERRRNACRAHARAHAQAHAHAHANATTAAAAKRGEHWQQLWSKRHGAGSSGERGREQQRSAAESRVGTAGIAKNRRQTQRREPAVAAVTAARGPRVWWKDDGIMEQVRPIFMPSVTGDGHGENDLFKDYFERSFEVERFFGQGVGGMEEENGDGDDDMDEDEDEERNVGDVGGDQRTREDSVMGDD